MFLFSSDFFYDGNLPLKIRERERERRVEKVDGTCVVCWHSSATEHDSFRHSYVLIHCFIRARERERERKREYSAMKVKSWFENISISTYVYSNKLSKYLFTVVRLKMRRRKKNKNLISMVCIMAEKKKRFNYWKQLSFVVIIMPSTVVCLGEMVSNRKTYKKNDEFCFDRWRKRNEGRLQIYLLDPHMRAQYVIIGASEKKEKRKAFVYILIALTRPLFSLSLSSVAFALTITTLTKMFSSPSINTFLTLVLNAITHHSFVHTYIHTH